jgi:hypothetical protein
VPDASPAFETDDRRISAETNAVVPRAQKSRSGLQSVITGGGKTGGVNHAKQQGARAGWVSGSDPILL